MAMITVPTRADLVSLFPRGGVLAEVGVFMGDFSEVILARAKPRELHLIDIWAGPMDCADENGENRRHVDDMETVYQELQERYRRSRRVTLVRGLSAAALESYPDGYFDAVYIDADHAPAAVKSDLYAAESKIKLGGRIAGHDYGPRRIFGPLMDTVDAFCQARGWVMTTITERDFHPSYILERKAAVGKQPTTSKAEMRAPQLAFA
jgi:hypothetical protein